MSFIKYLKKAIKPKSTENEYLQVLGESQLREVAAMWEVNAESFHIIGAYALHKYTQEQNFTREELISFKEGLAFIPSFLNECSLIKENLKKGLKESE